MPPRIPALLRVLSCTLALSAIASVPSLHAQGTLSTSAPASNAPHTTQPAPDIYPSLNMLADLPPTHTGFTFDRSMLQMARGLFEAQGMDAKRAAIAFSSITYDSYHYGQPVSWNPDAIASITSSYRAAGWHHLVNAHQMHSSSIEHAGPVTDLWLHSSGSDIDGLIILTRGVRNANVVQIACNLRPLDLIGLGGHFGIPKVDPKALMIPDPADR